MEIILPTLGKERQQTYSPFLPICPETGEVLEVGEDSTLKVGQKVMFTEHAGLDVKINFKKYLCLD